MLAAAIQGEARRIAQSFKLDWYFNAVEQHSLSPGGSGWAVNAFPGLLQESCPRVDLITRRWDDISGFHGVWRPKNAEKSASFMTQALLCRRICLALGPFGPDKGVRAYLVTRPIIMVTEYFPGSSDFFVNTQSYVVGLPSSDGAARNADGAFHPNEADRERFADLQPPDQCCEWEFEEVSPGSITSVLNGIRGGLASITDDALWHAADAYTKSPPETNAAALERSLLHGDGTGPETRLMALLENDARERTENLRAWIDAQMASVEDAMSRMAAGEGL